MELSVCYRSLTKQGKLKEQGFKVSANGKKVEKGVWIDNEWLDDIQLKVSADFLDWNLSLKSSVGSTIKTYRDVYGDCLFGLLNDKN